MCPRPIRTIMARLLSAASQPTGRLRPMFGVCKTGPHRVRDALCRVGRVVNHMGLRPRNRRQRGDIHMERTNRQTIRAGLTLAAAIAAVSLAGTALAAIEAAPLNTGVP